VDHAHRLRSIVSQPSAPLTTRWNGPGILHKMQELIDL
jgi:hypothetical protein